MDSHFICSQLWQVLRKSGPPKTCKKNLPVGPMHFFLTLFLLSFLKQVTLSLEESLHISTEISKRDQSSITYCDNLGDNLT